MATQIASFKRDWRRWSRLERMSVVVLLTAVAVAPLTPGLF